MKLKQDVIIMVDGPQGSGKSTCVQMLDEILEELKLDAKIERMDSISFKSLMKYFLEIQDYPTIILVDEIINSGLQPKKAINEQIAEAYRILITSPNSPPRHNIPARVFEISGRKSTNWFKDFNFALRYLVKDLIKDWKEKGLVSEQ